MKRIEPTTTKERLPDLGPPPKSSVDWFFTRRAGRSLDAAQAGLGPAEPDLLMKSVNRIIDGINWALGEGIKINLDLTKQK